MKNVDTIDKNMNKQEDIKTLASEIRRLNKRVKQLKESVFALQDLQHSIGIALMKFGKQLTRNTKHE